MRRSKVIIRVLQHVVRRQQRGIAGFGRGYPGFARRMLGLDCLKFLYCLCHIGSERGVGDLENLQPFLGGIQLGSEIEILLL